MITLPINGRSVMIGDRVAEGARQILLGEHRFTRNGGAWQPISEADWQTNVPSIEISATSIRGVDGEEYDQSVPYGADLEELLGARTVELTEEQREVIAVSNMLNTVPPRKLEGMSAEEIVEVSNNQRAEYNEANGVYDPELDAGDDEGEDE